MLVLMGRTRNLNVMNDMVIVAIGSPNLTVFEGSPTWIRSTIRVEKGVPYPESSPRHRRVGVSLRLRVTTEEKSVKSNLPSTE